MKQLLIAALLILSTAAQAEDDANTKWRKCWAAQQDQRVACSRDKTKCDQPKPKVCE